MARAAAHPLPALRDGFHDRADAGAVPCIPNFALSALRCPAPGSSEGLARVQYTSVERGYRRLGQSVDQPDELTRRVGNSPEFRRLRGPRALPVHASPCTPVGRDQLEWHSMSRER